MRWLTQVARIGLDRLLAARLIPMMLWLLAACAGTPALPAETPKSCEICGAQRLPTWVWVNDRIGQTRKAVCSACYTKCNEHCAACSLPMIRSDGEDLRAGRYLCQRCKTEAVLSDEAARPLFQEVRFRVQELLFRWPPAPQGDIEIRLCDKDKYFEMARKFNQPVRPAEGQLMGFAVPGGGPGEKDAVFIVNGLLPSAFKTVCAHEYTHLWIESRVSRKRRLHADTIEGICDWMAAKYATLENYTNELAILQKDDYSRGQARAFMEAEAQHGFEAVVRWVLQGRDKSVERDNLSQILVLSEGEPASAGSSAGGRGAAASLAVATEMPKTVYDKLTLQGIFSGARPRTMVNSTILRAQESALVPLGQTNVRVRCLSISRDAVSLQVEGKADPVELRMVP